MAKYIVHERTRDTAFAEVDLRAGDVGGQEVEREPDSREVGLEMFREATRSSSRYLLARDNLPCR